MFGYKIAIMECKV